MTAEAAAVEAAVAPAVSVADNPLLAVSAAGGQGHPCRQGVVKGWGQTL